jgi:DNA-binding transcriptional MocR family regulator
LPLTQFVERPGAIDLGWGHPDPALLPVDELRATAVAVLDRYGPDAVAYGWGAGPGPLIEAVAARLPLVDASGPATDEIVITAGNSWAIDQVATLLTEPGDVVLVESPTYHLALRILRDHPLEIVPVPFDGDGLVVDALPAILAGVRRAGGRPRLLYTVPTFHNPTGVSLSGDRRPRLVELAAAEGLLVVEDDAYRELAYDGPPPPSLWSLAAAAGSRGTVVRLGSFAKSLAPGLRVGYVTADAAIAARFADSGMLDSGGGISHLTSLMVATYAEAGRYATNVERLRAAYRERRDALLGELADALPRGATWTEPGGGYFTWVTLASGDARAALPAVEAAGTGYVGGRVFCPGSRIGDDLAGQGPFASAAARSFRLSFSRYSPAELREAARRLGRGLASGLAG